MRLPGPRGPRRPPRPLTPSEARTVRGWIGVVVALAIGTTLIPPDADPQVERYATMVVIATLTTGAINIRRPVGLRFMLGGAAACAFAYLCTTLKGLVGG